MPRKDQRKDDGTQHLIDFLKGEQDHPGCNHSVIKEIQAKSDSFQQERYRGATVRPRAQKFLLGEQPTSRPLADGRKHELDNEIPIMEHRGATHNKKYVYELDFFKCYDS